MRAMKRAALAIVSGVVLTFAYPRWNIEIAVWVWLLPLLGALWLRGPGGRRPRAFLLGYLAGLTFFIPNLSWVRHSSRVLPPAYATDDSWAGWSQELMGFGAVIGLAGYCALYFGLWSWFAARIARPRDASPWRSLASAALCAAAWPACEWLRGIVFTGFGWNGLGVPLHRNLPLIQMADSIGVSGLSFLPVFVSVTVFHLAARLVRAYRDGVRARLVGWDAAAAVILVAAVLIHGHSRILDQDRIAAAPGGTIPLDVALVQRNVPQAEKFSWDFNAEAAGHQYQRSAELTALHAEARPGAHPVDLVIWPESAVPAPLFAAPDHEPYFNSILALGDFSLLTGTEVQMPEGGWFNSAVLMRGSFDGLQFYHKAHLVPFGEFLPFRRIFPFSLLAGVLPGNFAAGTSFEPLKLEAPAVQLIPLICFEDTVGRVARRFVRPAPQLIVNLTNDGWFLQSAETEIHAANAVFRTVELRRPMVRACNTGVTCVIEPTGRMVSRLEDPENGSTFIEGVLRATARVPANPPLTVYARFGDWFSVLCLAICLTATAMR